MYEFKDTKSLVKVSKRKETEAHFYSSENALFYRLFSITCLNRFKFKINEIIFYAIVFLFFKKII